MSGFFGRESELAVLKAAAGDLIQGRGGVVAVQGVAGTGKSRLVREFRATLGDHYQWREARTTAESANRPFSSLVDLLAREWGIGPTDSSAVVAAKVKQGTDELLSDTKDASAYMGRLFGVEDESLNGVDPAAWRLRIRETVHAMLVELCRHAPTVVFVEDIHLADPSSLALLHGIVMDEMLPMLTVFTCRPPLALADEIAAQSGDRFTRIELDNLSQADAESLAASFLRTDALPEGIPELLQDACGGNPFHIEEMLASLVDSSVLAPSGDGWYLASPLSASSIPLGLDHVLARRICALGEGARAVLHEAAAIGRVVPYDVLRQVTSEVQQMDAHLTVLARHSIVEETGPEPGADIVFRHDLTRKAAYDDLPVSNRAELHERVASVLEGQYAERLASASDSLAYHYVRGQSLDKAVRYLMMSAGKSVERFALDEANEYFKQAYELVTGAPEQTDETRALILDIVNAWVYVFVFRGQYTEVLDLLEPHVCLAEGLGDPGRIAATHATLCPAYMSFGRLGRALASAEKALELAGATGDRMLLAGAHHAASWILTEHGRMDEGIEHGWRCHGLLETRDSSQVVDWVVDQMRWSSLNSVGMALYYKGDIEGSEELCGVLAGRVEGQDTRGGTILHMCRGLRLHAAGEYASAAMELEAGLSLSPDPAWAMALGMWRGMMLAESGSEDQALEALMPIWQVTKDNFYQIAVPSQVYVGYGWVHSGRYREALTLLGEMVEYLEHCGGLLQLCQAEYVTGKAYRVLAERARDDGDGLLAEAAVPGVESLADVDRTASEYLTRAVERALNIGAFGIACPALLEQARLHVVMGCDEESRRCAQLALEDAERRGASGHARSARAFL